MDADKVVIIVENSSGQLFVHQRSADKKLFPLHYGLGAGGNVEVGEKPINAARRELKEELGLSTEIESLFSFPFESNEVNHIVHAFKTIYDGEIKSCKEFQWSGWMDIGDVDQLATENKLCPDTKIVYMKWKILHR
jgi:8-oxo-dGTP pyrophosphatase MutT (NUDIX family)